MINVAVVGLGWWGKHVCNALHANSSSLKVCLLYTSDAADE